jgi:hypothetical protein
LLLIVVKTWLFISWKMRIKRACFTLFTTIWCIHWSILAMQVHWSLLRTSCDCTMTSPLWRREFWPLVSDSAEDWSIVTVLVLCESASVCEELANGEQF